MAGFNFKAEDKMKTKKSQITMFIIIGLVLFIVVGLVLYLAKSAVKKQVQASTRSAQQTPVDTISIKNFVTNCLDKLSKESALMIGAQGGYLFKSQGGTLIDYDDINDEGKFFIRYNNFKVVYNILPPRFESSFYTAKIPDYPWKTFPYTSSHTEVFDGFFGINNMPFLYSTQGPHSIQVQMESYIDNNIENCMDTGFLKNQSYDVDIKKPKTEVTIGSSDLTVNIELPITLKNKNTKETFELSKFSTTIDLRLKDIYKYAKNLVDSDVKNIKFDIGKLSNPDFGINIFQSFYSSDDIIIVTDQKSLINGKPFQYVFARKNRAPALYYLTPDVLYFDSGSTITEEDLLQGQELKAEDPDEDKLQYSIKALAFDSSLPKVLDVPELKFRIEVSDGSLTDYQDLTVYER